MSKLLLDENPLVIQPRLAKIVGLNESIVMQQLHYWLEKSNHIIAGRPWIYNTYKSWNQQFPFWSERTIRRIISNLEKKELIYSSSEFNKLDFDKTKWYSINYEKLSEIESGQSDQRKGHSVLGKRTPCPKAKDNLTTPIPENTTEITTEIMNKSSKFIDNASFHKVYDFYLNNIAPVPTYYEREELMSLYEEFNDFEVLIEAIKIAVSNNARNLNYIKRILIDWKEKGIKNIHEAKAYTERRFRKNELCGKHSRNNKSHKIEGNKYKITIPQHNYSKDELDESELD